VEQREQLGTGHAVLQTKELLAKERGTIMVLCGDTPLLTAELLARFHEEHVQSRAKATVLTAIMPNAKGYGRIIRRESGEVLKIVEHKDATEEERKIREINAGIYCFDAQALFSALAKVTNDNAQGEYYLPDVLGILRDAGEKIWAVVADNYESTLGINSRSQLAVAERILRRRKVEELMADGVTIMDPHTTFIDAEVHVGMDTVIYPFTFLEGVTVIGEDCCIGPHVRFQNTVVGDGVKAHYVYAHDADVESGTDLGQFNHIRPDSHLGAGVKLGNFVEVKNSDIGAGSKLPHLSYIGDCDMGEHVNMGCGTITVNYDGRNKFRTVIGDNVFVGCNSNLVAPVALGEDSYVAAGSTITRDVPAGTLAVARARQKEIEGWRDKRR
jgi:UDP-N-acetylglucosamine diphosphorylase/glucosamine-1-phosphate N-acetyltransferase